jgi:hypothetical protein
MTCDHVGGGRGLKSTRETRLMVANGGHVQGMEAEYSFNGCPLVPCFAAYIIMFFFEDLTPFFLMTPFSFSSNSVFHQAAKL